MSRFRSSPVVEELEETVEVEEHPPLAEERRRWRENRRVQRRGSTSVNRSVVDCIVSFWIHWFENRNCSILEDLNQMM